MSSGRFAVSNCSPYNESTIHGSPKHGPEFDGFSIVFGFFFHVKMNENEPNAATSASDFEFYFFRFKRKSLSLNLVLCNQ